jgi:hypothetical protein
MSSTYNPNLIAVLAGGVPIGALNRDVFAAIAYASPTAMMREDTSGNTIFSINRARQATVTLTIERTSAGNTVLSALHQRQLLTGGGAFQFAIIDNNVPDGIAFFIAPEARVEKMPDQEWGAEASPIVWTILCGECEHNVTALPSASALPL